MIYKKGIKIVGDICNTDRTMKSEQDICEQFDVKPVDFITFHALKVSINIFVRDQILDNRYVSMNQILDHNTQSHLGCY